jgi:hypothetical protein
MLGKKYKIYLVIMIRLKNALGFMRSLKLIMIIKLKGNLKMESDR